MRKTASLFKALSDETRLRIMALLTCGELCVCDLIEVMELPQSTVSRHLATLRQAGLVADRRQGVWIYYRLGESSEPVGRELLDILSGGLGHLEQIQADRKILDALMSRKESDKCQ
ncbi:HTH-type transcriptional repressor CzrA [bacterium BMS3Abin14]|nr:HTH-type transcriptional repressor CzrA [bacterium BMS3Abin14]